MAQNDAYKLLVADDELSMRQMLEFMLEKEGYKVTCAANGREAIECVQKARFDLLLCDIRLGDISGLEVLRAAKESYAGTVVIMISAYASTETAVEAMNDGAYDYLPKPFDINELKGTIANALKLKTLEREKQSLNGEVKRNLHFGKIIGNHHKMRQIYSLIEQVADTVTNIFISGESGTGKELIAQAIHEQSSRSNKPFVTINCGGIPDALIESELFGSKKGAFTGAVKDKKGLFQTAHKGTIFLDEIGELSLPLQVKLLRAVQEKKIKPVGGFEDIEVDIRIISATNKNLEDEVIAGRFREDLFYRLNVIEIKVPPLRERKSDLRALAQHFLEKYASIMGKDITKISSYAIDLLSRYNFPGNIRELENLIERSVALANTNIILPDSLRLSMHKNKRMDNDDGDLFDLEKVPDGVELDRILNQIEHAYVKRAIEESGGNKKKAAKLLGINTRSIRYRLDKFGIN